MFSLSLALAKVCTYLYRLNIVLPDLVKIGQVRGSSVLISLVIELLVGLANEINSSNVSSIFFHINCNFLAPMLQEI